MGSSSALAPSMRPLFSRCRWRRSLSQRALSSSRLCRTDFTGRFFFLACSYPPSDSRGGSWNSRGLLNRETGELRHTCDGPATTQKKNKHAATATKKMHLHATFSTPPFTTAQIPKEKREKNKRKKKKLRNMHALHARVLKNEFVTTLPSSTTPCHPFLKKWTTCYQIVNGLRQDR